MSSSHEVTRLLHEWANGGESALEALTPLVYAELRLCLAKMPYGSSDCYLSGKQIGSSASENMPELCRMIELQPSARPPRPSSVADFNQRLAPVAPDAGQPDPQ
jgi:hypothetical protein